MGTVVVTYGRFILSSFFAGDMKNANSIHTPWDSMVTSSPCSFYKIKSFHRSSIIAGSFRVRLVIEWRGAEDFMAISWLISGVILRASIRTSNVATSSFTSLRWWPIVADSYIGPANNQFLILAEYLRQSFRTLFADRIAHIDGN